VLEIHVPEVMGSELSEALRELEASFIGFLISFVVPRSPGPDTATCSR
jgi:uncharacterized membrane protein